MPVYSLRISLTIALLMAVIPAVYAQAPETLWELRLGSGNLSGYYVQQSEDAGFAIVGKYCPGSVDDIALTRTDPAGHVLWQQTYGGTDYEWGDCVEITPDGGYIICGYTSSFGYGASDAYLIKTDSNGIEEWSNTYGGSSTDHGESVKCTIDGGYILVGDKFFPYSYGHEIFLVKVDESGNEVWSHNYGGDGSEFGIDVQQTSDGGYIVLAEDHTPGFLSKDLILMKTDSLGEEEWFRIIDWGADENAKCIEITQDGGYIIAGYTDAFGGYDGYLFKTDDQGNEIWIQNYGGTSTDRAYSVRQTLDAGYIFCGSTSSWGPNFSNFWVTRTDESGNYLWSRIYGGGGSDAAQCVQITQDEGFILAGSTDSWGPSQIYFIRLESENFNTDLTYVSGSPVPAGGGDIEYDLLMEYSGSEATDFEGWLEISYEGGSPTTISQRSFEEFQPGWIINRPGMHYPVPATYAAGEYRLQGKVGDFSDNFWSLGYFDFEKEGVSEGIEFTPWIPDGDFVSPFDEILSDDLDADIPIEFSSLESYPNPFNASTVIGFQLPVAGSVKLEIYDLTGRLVESLLHKSWWETGRHEATWDAVGLPSGVYVIRLAAGELTAVKKVVFMK